MTWSRFWACLLIWIQCSAMAGLYQWYVYAAALAALAVPSLLTDWRVTATRTTIFRFSAAAAAAFLAYFAVDPPDVPPTLSALRTDLALVLAQYLLLWQVVALYWRTPHGKPASWLPLMGVATLFCLGDITTQGPLAELYQALALTFTLVLGLYASSRRDFQRPGSGRHWLSRTVALGCVAALLTATGWGASRALNRHERDLERVLTRLFSQQTTVESGFSGTGRLDSVTRSQSQNDDAIALRVFSDDGAPPTYWRGQVFEEFRWSQWNAPRHYEIYPFHPVFTRLMELPEGHRPFSLAARTAFTSDLTRYDCHPAQTSELRCFAPLTTQIVATEATALSFQRHGVAYKRSQHAPKTYTVYVGGLPAFRALTDSERQRLLRTHDLDERIEQRARELFAGCRTTEDKIAAVEDYFRQNYEYALDIEVPPQQNPLTYFLLEQPAAHCEYFATGTAMLLRLGGIPCRYVTGYLVAEPHSYGDSWIARNRHAHAWVEAFDAEADTWRIVDTTPALGRPGSEPVPLWRRMLEYFSALYDSVQRAVREGRPVEALLAVCRSPFAIAVPAACLLGAWLLWWWRRRPTTRRQPGDDAATRACRRLLRKLESRLRRYRIRREPHETLSQFGARLRARETARLRKAAAWLDAYVHVRYRTQVDDTDVQALSRAYAEIWR